MDDATPESTDGVPVDRSTLLKTAVGFVAAVLALYLFGWAIGWHQILTTLRETEVQWLVLACLSSLVCLVIWAKAWDEVLHILSVDISFPSLTTTYFAATFADYATPFGKAGGNPLVAYVLSTNDQTNYQESLAGVVSADLLNLLPFFTFATVGLAAIVLRGRVPPGADLLVYGLGTLGLLVPVVLLVGWRFRDWVRHAVASVTSPLSDWVDLVSTESIHNRIEEFYGHVELLRGHPRRLAETLVFSFGGWLFFAAPLYLAGRAVGIHLSPLVVLFVVPASSMASLVPTPGGLGGVEIAVAGLLVPLAELPLHTATAIALLYRVASYWVVLVVAGVAAFWKLYAH